MRQTRREKLIEALEQRDIILPRRAGSVGPEAFEQLLLDELEKTGGEIEEVNEDDDADEGDGRSPKVVLYGKPGPVVEAPGCPWM